MNRITIATVALVLPIVVGTLATQKQHKPTPESLIKPALKTPRMQAPKETPLPTESQRPGEPNNAAFLARLQELRTKWEVWAREHGEDLAAMLRETGNERAAYDRVLNAMPSQFEYNGNTVLNGADLDVPDLPFVYVPQYQKHTGLWKMPNNIKPYILRDGAEGEFARMRADEELEKKYPSNTRRFIPERDRERFRDIAIVTSFMKSGNAYTLWISGRITEHTPTGIEFTLQSYEHKAIRYSEGEEIVPPYSFLTE